MSEERWFANAVLFSAAAASLGAWETGWDPAKVDFPLFRQIVYLPAEPRYHEAKHRRAHFSPAGNRLAAEAILQALHSSTSR